MARAALGLDFRVFALNYGDKPLAKSTDISALDPASPNVIEAGWGGLTGLSSGISGAVTKAVLAAK